METFDNDPKPGRLVLPLVLIGMIATTYTFINRVATDNNLDIVDTDVSVEETVEEVPAEEETTTTTTTTLPENVIAYLEEISSEKIQSIDIAGKVLEANDNWDNQNVTYQEAKDEFAEFIEDTKQFLETVKEPGPPTTFAGLVKSHEELISLAELIYLDTEELLAGLTSSDTGEQRSSALESFNNNIDLFQLKIDEIVAINTTS